jgi:DNA-binding response OmpR family regulator
MHKFLQTDCRRIKGSNSGVIVVQVSASATLAKDATSALNAGADAYLIEPVDPEVLIATVRALLRLRHPEKELATANEKKLREANEQLNAANKALRRSDEDLQQFAHVASHDLQEPLRTIAAHAQLIERSLGPRLGPGEHESLTLVASAAERMHGLARHSSVRECRTWRAQIAGGFTERRWQLGHGECRRKHEGGRR